jgi:hypothetical protein
MVWIDIAEKPIDFSFTAQPRISTKRYHSIDYAIMSFKTLSTFRALVQNIEALDILRPYDLGLASRKALPSAVAFECLNATRVGSPVASRESI